MESTNRRRRRQKGYPCNALRLLIRIWGIITSTGKIFIKFKQNSSSYFFSFFFFFFVRLLVSTCSVVCLYRIIYLYTEHPIYNQIYIYMKYTLIRNVYIYQRFSFCAFDFALARARACVFFILFYFCFVIFCACDFSSVSTVFDFILLCLTILLTCLFVRLFCSCCCFFAHFSGLDIVISFRSFFSVSAQRCTLFLSLSLYLPLVNISVCCWPERKRWASRARWEILIKQLFKFWRFNW